MYNQKDIQFVGKHDYDKDSAILSGLNKTFSIGIFRWELKSNGKSMKKGKAVVRVIGEVSNASNVFIAAEEIVNQLDAGKWGRQKTFTVK